MKTKLLFRALGVLGLSSVASWGWTQDNLAPIVSESRAMQMAPMIDMSRDVHPDLDLSVIEPVAFGRKSQSVGCADVGCASCGAAVSCESCGSCAACCPCGAWCHRFMVFGEGLFLRPRSAEVVYAVQVNSAVSPPGVPVQIAGLGIVDPDFEPAFRFGFGFVIDYTRSITAAVTHFESQTSNSTPLTNPLNNSVVQGVLFHPLTTTANISGVVAGASYGIDFDFIDIDYRELFSYDWSHQYNFVVGARYAHLDQDFGTSVNINGGAFLNSQINFDGAGVRAGLEGERFTANRQLFMYGRLLGSLVAGEFRASHIQGDAANPSLVNTSWKAGRLVPIVDTEFGVGWQTRQGNLRLSAGYMYSVWFNTPVIDEWAAAVQSNSFRHLDKGLSFDGLTGRVELRF